MYSLRLQELYRRFGNLWIHLATPWIRLKSWPWVLTSKSLVWIMDHGSGLQKVWFGSWNMNPEFKRFDSNFGSQLLTLKGLIRIVERESAQFSLDSKDTFLNFLAQWITLHFFWLASMFNERLSLFLTFLV
jgi:hypothetical protein